MKKITGDDPRFKIGVKYGKLEIISERYYREQKTKSYIYCRVRCSCGKEFEVSCSNLTGQTRRCNSCANALRGNTKHGQAGTRLYRCWQSMIARCLNENDKNYKNYGKRGIKVCLSWREDFTVFRAWALQNGYRDDLEIDRIDVNGDYQPDNCRWTTETQQCRNKRNNHRLRAFGEEKSLAEWVEDVRCLVSYPCLLTRIRRGCEPEYALTHPRQTNRRRLKR